MADVGQRNGVGDSNATFVLLLENDVGRILVNSNTEPFQLILDHSLVSQGLIDIENNEDKMAGFGNGDNLATSTLTILGSLDDTRQIKHLDSGAIVLDLSRYCGQCCEFISSS